MRACVIIPAYNEERTIGSVIDRVREHGYDPVIVNDGSRDATAAIAQKKGCRVCSHPINRGLGAALRTGFAFAINHAYDYVITLDADGQHDPADIARVIEQLNAGYEVVIGSRMTEIDDMPWSRVWGNRIANVVTIGGHITTDSQSGLRGMKVTALKKMTLHSSTPPGMEISSEIIEETFRHNLRYTEVPIKPIYTDYSLSKGQSFSVGLHTWARLLCVRMFK